MSIWQWLRRLLREGALSVRGKDDIRFTEAGKDRPAILFDPDTSPFRRPNVSGGYPLDEKEKAVIDRVLEELRR